MNSSFSKEKLIGAFDKLKKRYNTSTFYNMIYFLMENTQINAPQYMA